MRHYKFSILKKVRKNFNSKHSHRTGQANWQPENGNKNGSVIHNKK